MTRIQCLLTAAVLHLCFTPSLFADGFRFERAIEHEAHVVLHLTPEQIATVGRERKLILTDEQHENLKQFAKRVPRILGVESFYEPDCSCHISSALWTAKNQVTIWVKRLAYDKDGSKRYYEVRKQEGYFTADANGRIYSAGKLVPWKQFENAVKTKREGQYIQLSMPPAEVPGFTARVFRLKAKYPFFFRL